MGEQVSGAVASGIFAAGLALLGVEPVALLWSSIGAGAVLVFSKTRPGWHEMLTVLVSALIGAAGGHFLADFGFEGSRRALVFWSLVCGAGAKPLLSAAIEGAAKRLGGGGA